MLLAQCSPDRTPQEVKRLLDARANPDIVVATETWGTTPPLSKFINLGKPGYVPAILYSRALSPYCKLYQIFPWRARFLMFRLRVYMFLYLYLVHEIRQLLLDYGATNTKELQEDWRSTEAAIENEPQWLENFHHDPRVSF